MSKILEQIKKDRLQARKDRDTFTAVTLTTLLGEASPSGNDTISDKEVQKVIEKFAKNQRSMLAHDLSTLQRSEINRELKIYEKYLPKQLTEDEIKRILCTEYTVYVDGNGKGNLNVGSVMRYLSSNYAGQYDGKVASKVAKEFVDSIGNGVV
ncbi:MAG: putative Yqey-like protein [Prokaryotic dsDNA virus sp.]|jgi:uncharacterized protein YqeY|nr:MAG: putative Yqey-like protein [Prokaryotic dsDNA virus sp.]|tara:strand:- start:45142 stop:45600 length:459 start_codon:yes stop_codon:yes gene_type:complete